MILSLYKRLAVSDLWKATALTGFFVPNFNSKMGKSNIFKKFEKTVGATSPFIVAQRSLEPLSVLSVSDRLYNFLPHARHLLHHYGRVVAEICFSQVVSSRNFFLCSLHQNNWTTLCLRYILIGCYKLKNT